MSHREQKKPLIRQEQQTGNTAQGVQDINATGQFVGNVSETIAENPVVANATKETQEFFGESSK